jgi:hypothetical protein
MPGAKKFYFYQVHSNPNRDLPYDDHSQLLTRYFRTADQVAEYVGCGRCTVFNVIKGRYDRSISTNGFAALKWWRLRMHLFLNYFQVVVVL